MNASPRVTALINNYNYGRFLPEAIESALNQTYGSLEIIVVDDGSTDDSVEIMRRYAAKNPRIVPVVKENGGQASAYNAGIEAATGEIICFLDSDDMWDTRKVEMVVEAHRTHAFVHHPVLKGDRPNFVEPDPSYDRQRLLKMFGFQHTISPSSGLSIRRDLVEQIFPVPEPTLRICADIFVRVVAAYLGNVYTIRDILCSYRVHDQNRWYSPKRDVSQLREIYFHYIDLASQWLSARSYSPIPRHDHPVSIEMYRYLLRVHPERRYFVYGTGGYAEKTVHWLHDCGVPVEACVESRPAKPAALGRPLVSDIQLLDMLQPRDVVLIGGSFADAIQTRMRDLGVPASQLLRTPLLSGHPRWY